MATSAALWHWSRSPTSFRPTPTTLFLRPCPVHEGSQSSVGEWGVPAGRMHYEVFGPIRAL